MAYKGYYFEFNDDNDNEEYFIRNVETDVIAGSGIDTKDCEAFVDIMIEQNVKHESEIDWSKA
jgi:hypothetical protein